CCPVQAQQDDGPALPEPIDLMEQPPIPPSSPGPSDFSDWVISCRIEHLRPCPDEGKQLPTEMTRIQDAEEQENGAAEEKSTPQEVSEQLKKVLEPQPLDGSRAGQRKVDTLDFRPSDAKPGQFDRIPF